MPITRVAGTVEPIRDLANASAREHSQWTLAFNAARGALGSSLIPPNFLLRSSLVTSVAPFSLANSLSMGRKSSEN